MQGVYSWLKTIVIFMIFLTILSNLLGKSDFKKYINVVTGLLLVLVTMNPILKLLSMDDSFDYYFDSVSFNLQTTEVANEMRDAEEGQRQIILENYKEEIVKHIEDLLKEEELYLLNAKVSIEEDSSSEDYAKIKQITLKATYSVPDSESETTIEKVEIPKIEIGTSAPSEVVKNENSNDFLSPMEIHIKNVLSDFYNMSEDNINVSIQGG